MLTLLTATNLVSWADTRASLDTLALLVRRLILASTNPEWLDFPAGDSVNGPGYDGLLRTNEASLNIPAGQSVWEMGVGQSPSEKANADYNSRVADSLTLNPPDTTFVFVTPRRWTGKSEWEEEKRAESVWRDVRFLDADNLEQWLEICPAVAASARRQIVGLPEGIRDIDEIWENWGYAERIRSSFQHYSQPFEPTLAPLLH